MIDRSRFGERIYSRRWRYNVEF